jgi:hypothetical protein
MNRVALCLNDLNPLFIAGEPAEQDLTGYLCKQGMIGPHADIFAGMYFRPALTDNNTSGRDFLPAETFHSQHFWIAVPTVGTAAAAFFMRHTVVTPSQALIETI